MDPHKRSIHPLARLEQWLAYIILMTILAIWVISRPPPEHWLPIAVLILAAIGIVVVVSVSLRNGGKPNDKSGSRA